MENHPEKPFPSVKELFQLYRTRGRLGEDLSYDDCQEIVLETEPKSSGELNMAEFISLFRKATLAKCRASSA